MKKFTEERVVKRCTKTIVEDIWNKAMYLPPRITTENDQLIEKQRKRMKFIKNLIEASKLLSKMNITPLECLEGQIFNR